MHQTQRLLNSMTSYLYDEYIRRILVLIATITLLLVSNVSSAFVTHPTATAICSANTTKGSLSSNDYTSLAASNDTYITTDDSGRIPLQVQLSIKESSVSTAASTSVAGTTDNSALRFIRNFPNSTAYSDITFNFQNSDTGEPLFLSSVALSTFDIDKNIFSSTTSSNGWNDYVKITGMTKNGSINSTFQSIAGSSVEFSASGIGSDSSKGLRLPASSANFFNCRNSLDTSCQGSIFFDEPVKSVTLRYNNASTITNPSVQVIDVRLENYCYTPNSIFSGIVFNDNGGISADERTKQDISNTFTGNSSYFNGIYDSVSELGIYNSSLSIFLTDCNGNNIVTTSSNPQTVSNILTTKGKYSFIVAASALVNKTKVCIVQVEPNTWDYAVDTTTNNREVTLTSSVYDYNNLDFGEVQANNASLVLIKSQYVHDCSLKDLMTIGINYTGEATAAYSKKTIDDIEPAQCIAYRIEAINRGNVPLTDIIIRDTLQKKGDSGALVTSTLTTPTPIGENGGFPTFSNESVSIGNNGTVITNTFSLGATNSTRRQAIRFNTKYGTTMNAQ